MYSRNFGTFENISAVKLNSQLKGNTAQKENTIPVKTFSDNSAVERFNSLGRNRAHHQVTDNNYRENLPLSTLEENALDEVSGTENNDLPEPKENTEAVILSEDGKKDTEEYADKVLETEKTHISLPFDIKKLSGIFDSDLLLIGLAAAMIFLGNNETNDKLTPIALLAIMFL